MNPIEVGNAYKKFMFELINLLQMNQHFPGEKVISQNDPVLNADKEWFEDEESPNMYFIVTGNYKVESLMFVMKKKRKAMKEENQEGEQEKNKKTKKTLRSGDYFGEIALLFGCRRSATVKSRSYCGCALLSNKDFR